MKLDELNDFNIALEIGDKVWRVVYNWKYFERQTVGFQLVRAVDSIAANISEGYGRFSFKENKQFCYYSRGSLFETKTWIAKANNRGLIGNEDFENFKVDIDFIGKKLNSYINSIGKKSIPDLNTNDK